MIDGSTKLTGVFGDPVSHSLSPLIQNAAFQHAGLNYVYLAMHVHREHLPEAVRGIPALGMAGVNITAPHKETVVPLLHELSPEAALLGAVNTVFNAGGRLKGYNTDVDGFFYLLQNMGSLAVKGERVCLLGAGGAARAVCLALARAEAGHLTILNRTAEKGRAVMDMLIKSKLFTAENVSFLTLEQEITRELAQATFLINTLSVDPVEEGLLPPREELKRLKAAIDLRYSPPELPFLKWAGRGCVAVNGLNMLLGQGVRAFEIFTGREAPLQVMKNLLRRHLPTS